MTIKNKKPYVTIVVVNYNGKKYLEGCFNALFCLDYHKNGFEVILVDNGSTDDSLDFTAKTFPVVRIIKNECNNFARANNLAIKASKGEYIGLVNNDARVSVNWLKESVSLIETNGAIAGIGSKIYFMDGTLQSAGHQEYPNFYWGDRGFREEDRGQYNYVRDVPSICGAAALYRKRYLEEMGLFDEDFVMYLEDVDMGIRCQKKGWKLLFCPTSVAHHEFHGTIKSEERARMIQEKNRLLLIAKHWPEKLADALSGRGHYYKGDLYENEDSLHQIMPLLLKKVIKTHGSAKAEEILDEVFKSLSKISNLNYDSLFQKTNDFKKQIDTEARNVQVLQEQLAGKSAELAAEKEKARGMGALVEQERSEKEVMGQSLREKDTRLDHLQKELAKREKELAGNSVELAAEKEKARGMGALVEQERSEKEAMGQSLREKDVQMSNEVKNNSLLSLRLDNVEKNLKQKEIKIHEQQNAIQEKERELVISLENSERLQSQIRHMEENLNGSRQQLQAKEAQLLNISNELKMVYGSTGFRFLLKPAWGILFPVKQALRKIFKRIKLLMPDFTDDFRNLCLGFYVYYITLKNLMRRQRPFSCCVSKAIDIGRQRGLYFKHILKNKCPPPPKSMVLMITKICNLNCSFCDLDGYNYANNKIPAEKAYKIIDSASLLGITELAITGGEPLTHTEFFDIVKYAKLKRLYVNAATNGFFVKPMIGKLVESQIDALNFSIDGFADTHNKLRNGQVFEKAIEGIMAVKASGAKIALSVNYVVTNENIFELETVHRYFSEGNIQVDFWPVNNQPQLYLRNKKERQAFFTFCNKLFREGKISKERFLYYLKGLDYFNGRQLYVRCLGLFNSFGVDVDGNILPCCVWGNRILDLGSMPKDDIGIMWYSEEYRRARTDIFYKGCVNCYNIALCDFISTTGKDFVVKEGTCAPEAQACFTGVERAPRVLKEKERSIIKPSSVVWSSTIRCNASCLHCDNWKVRNPNKELTTEDIVGSVYKLKDWLGDNLTDFIIGGGEPFLRNDILEVANICNELKIRASATTNGILLNQGLCDEIIHSNLSNLNISLDGLSGFTHDFTRNTPGLFNRISSALAYMSERKKGELAVSISTIIMNTNIDELVQMEEFVRDNGLSWIYFLPLAPNFNSPMQEDPSWHTRSRLWPKDAGKAVSVINQLIRIRDNGGAIANSSYHLNLMKEYYENPGRKFFEQCTAGRRMFTITEDGHILLCPLLKPLGTIYDKDIRESYHSLEAQLQRLEIDKCTRMCKILGCYNDT